MIPIQIIEIYSDVKAIKVVIEKYNNKKFTIRISIKNNNDINFPSIETLNERFDTAKNALLYIVHYFNDDKILKVSNQVSDLLSIDEVKNITDYNSVYQY